MVSDETIYKTFRTRTTLNKNKKNHKKKTIYQNYTLALRVSILSISETEYILS